jgi:lambda family phage portal protein
VSEINGANGHTPSPKQGWLNKTIAYFSPETALKRKYFEDRIELAYDAANPIRERRGPPSIMSVGPSESMSNQRDRVRLMAEARSLTQNYSFVKSVLIKESMYVTGDLRYQSNTGEPEIDEAYETYLKEWQENCDITNRHNFRHLVSMAHMSMRRDGDFGFVLVTHGDTLKLQCVEADRIGNPHQFKNTDNYISGITINEYGQPTNYKIYKRTINGQYKDPVDVKAGSFIHYFDPLRCDQYRGVTAFDTAVGHARDLYDLLKMEKMAVKWGASHAGVITKSDPGPDKWTSTKIDPLSPNGLKPEKMEPGKILRLEQGDSVTVFPNNSRPSPTFNGFISTLVREMANGLGLPYAFVWDMKDFGGATARLETQAAQRTFKRFQGLLSEQVLGPIKNKILAHGIATGAIPPHAKFRKGRWQFGAHITADLGYEVQSAIAMLGNGLKTHQTAYGELGMDFEEESEQLAKEIAHLSKLSEKYQIPIEAINRGMQGMTQMVAQYEQAKEAEDAGEPTPDEQEQVQQQAEQMAQEMMQQQQMPQQ